MWFNSCQTSPTPMSSQNSRENSVANRKRVCTVPYRIWHGNIKKKRQQGTLNLDSAHCMRQATHVETCIRGMRVMLVTMSLIRKLLLNFVLNFTVYVRCMPSSPLICPIPGSLSYVESPYIGTRLDAKLLKIITNTYWRRSMMTQHTEYVL